MNAFKRHAFYGLLGFAAVCIAAMFIVGLLGVWGALDVRDARRLAFTFQAVAIVSAILALPCARFEETR